MKRTLIASAALVAAAVLLAGCPLTRPDSAEAQVAQIAVQYGVAKYIGRVPEAERFTRAQRIARVVEAVEAAARGSAEVTLPLLREAIQPEDPDTFSHDAPVFLLNAEFPRARMPGNTRPRCKSPGRAG